MESRLMWTFMVSRNNGYVKHISYQTSFVEPICISYKNKVILSMWQVTWKKYFILTNYNGRSESDFHILQDHLLGWRYTTQVHILV